MTVRDWLKSRLGGTPAEIIPGGPSWAYVLGGVIVILLAVEAITGAALAAFYSPSTTDAWASVAYIQDQMSLGWLVRGLHYHGASALVIVTGLHLVQTAIYGAYRKPRDLVWWLGILLLLLVLGFTISGYVLRWDQAGYTANRVEIGIAAGTPIFGGKIRSLAIGGNDYGTLTLTRFYALHVVLLPPLVALVTFGHAYIARRHGPTPRVVEAITTPAQPRWPVQAVRTMVAAALAFGALLVYTISTHGADLASPANPSVAYDARPLWYFRWLFELRQLTGSMEEVAALTAPAIVLGYLVALPLLDRGIDRSWRARKPWIIGTVAMCVVVSLLTLMSFDADRGEALEKRQADASAQATRDRALAVKYGVPANGPQDLASQIPMARGRRLYEQRCKSCHDASRKDRKGPVIAAGHGSRAWLRAFLVEPSGDAFWGKTKLAKTDDAMKAVTLTPAELDQLTEAVYAESGATDVDPAKRAAGREIFDKACNDCHSLEEGAPGASGPGLGGTGSRDYYTSFISNPKSALHMGADKSEMPRFDRELSIVDRDALAEYLVWLRTATPADVTALEPL